MIADLQAEYNAGGSFPQASPSGNPDRDALGRVLASEGYSGNKRVGFAAAMVGIGQAEVNRARYAGRSLYYSIAPYGEYGPQGSGGRKVASSRTPNTWQAHVADTILSGDAENNVGAAQHYFDPYVQDGGHQGATTLSYDAAGIVKRWHDTHKWAWIGNVDTLDAYALMFFRHESNASVREETKQAALAEVAAGRLRVYRNANGQRRLNSVAYAAGGGLLLFALLGIGAAWWYSRRR